MKRKQMIIGAVLFLLGIVLGIAICSLYTKKEETSSDSKKSISESITEEAVSVSTDAINTPVTSEGVILTAEAATSSPSSAQADSPKENTNTTKDAATSQKTASISATKTEGTIRPAQTGALHVSGPQLVDANGTPVQLKGISTHGIGWFPEYINESFFQELRTEWNADVVRLAMYTAEYNGYCTGGNKEELKNLIKKGVEYATKQNLYVIIDWHILSDGNPHTYKEEAKAFFSEMSALYANHTNVFYEICNEPNGGTSWAQIKAYAEEIIPVIRSNDADGIILVGTPNWSQYVNEAAQSPITGYSNIMYTLHFYADTHRDSLRNTMKSAIASGLPIFVTEYGICDASGSGAINTTQANEWVRTMNSLGISYVAWNISNKNETSAIFNTSCKKTAGFTQDDLSNSGKWLYEMLTGKTTLESNLHNPVEQQNQNTSTENNSSSSTASSAVTNATLSYELTLTNQWESNGETFYQYNATIKNNTGSACSSWNVTIPFTGAIKLSNGWNGNYTVNGSNLTITSVDYNGTIASGGCTGDVGFIISGSCN